MGSRRGQPPEGGGGGEFKGVLLKVCGVCVASFFVCVAYLLEISLVIEILYQNPIKQGWVGFGRSGGKQGRRAVLM